jgi:micrococcal nuclease
VPTPVPALAPTTVPTPVITPSPIPTPPQPQSFQKYYASSGSGGKKFHLAGCRYVGQINSANLITFSSRQAALDAGYGPCSICNP